MAQGEMTETATRLRSRLRQLLAMLAVEFLLGMGANLIGLPSEVSGGARVATLILIGLHVFVAIGILVVAIQVSTSRPEQAKRPTTAGLVSVIVTFLAGMGTLGSGSAWLSFVMAAGFLAAAAFYGTAYVEANRTSGAVS